MAREEVSAVRPGAQVREVVTDKGCHSRETVLELKHLGLRSYVSEPDRVRQLWKAQAGKQKAVYANPTADPRGAGETAAAPAERTGRTTVCASVRDGRLPLDLRPGPCQCAQAAVGAGRWIQSGTLDAPSDRCRDPPQAPGPRGGGFRDGKAILSYHFEVAWGSTGIKYLRKDWQVGYWRACSHCLQ